MPDRSPGTTPTLDMALPADMAPRGMDMAPGIDMGLGRDVGPDAGRPTDADPDVPAVLPDADGDGGSSDADASGASGGDADPDMPFVIGGMDAPGFAIDGADAPASSADAADAADASGDASESDAVTDAPPPTDAELQRNGLACTAGSQCMSGFCVDGFCCQSACNGICESCGLANWQGVCAPIPNGEDPENNCDPTTDPADLCRRDGMCDGLRKCRPRSAGTTCGAETCTGSTEYSSRTCDGLGDCRPAAAKPCDPYVCAGTVCAASCTSSAQCIATSFCDTVRGRCTGLQPAGAVCAMGAECLSGNCVDGVCCLTTCSGACQRCNLPGFMGSCTPIAANTDPDNECAGEAQSTCGLDGSCDGRGACQKWGPGTICVQASCVGSTETSASTCNGTGTCSPIVMKDCSPLICGGNNLCLGTCSADTDCKSGYFCDTNSMCAPQRANGGACMRKEQCVNANCVSGICCNTACAGTCSTCATGTCTQVGAGQPAPAGQCTMEAASTCGRTGNCNGMGGCELYAMGTSCGAASCANNSQIAASICSGTGTCMTGATTSCAGYGCNGTVCRTSCTLLSDCASGYYCDVNQCKPK